MYSKEFSGEVTENVQRLLYLGTMLQDYLKILWHFYANIIRGFIDVAFGDPMAHSVASSVIYPI